MTISTTPTARPARTTSADPTHAIALRMVALKDRDRDQRLGAHEISDVRIRAHDRDGDKQLDAAELRRALGGLAAADRADLDAALKQADLTKARGNLFTQGSGIAVVAGAVTTMLGGLAALGDAIFGIITRVAGLGSLSSLFGRFGLPVGVVVFALGLLAAIPGAVMGHRGEREEQAALETALRKLTPLPANPGRRTVGG